MTKKQSLITLIVILLIIAAAVSYKLFYTDTKVQAPVDTQKAIEQEYALPTEGMVTFYYEPSEFSDVKVGDTVSVDLMIDTNGETINEFAATFSYYKKRLEFVSEKINPAFQGNLQAVVKDTTEDESSDKTIETIVLNNVNIKGKEKIAGYTFKAIESGMGFFDIVRGDMKAINDKGENIADVEVGKLKFDII